jgi:hypothetical protein
MFNPQFPSKLAVKRLMMLQTGTYNDMMRRPYHLTADASIVNRLHDDTLGGTQIDHNHVAGVAGMLLRPTAQATQFAHIDNGWGTQRFQFFMSVIVNNGLTRSEEYILSGYTDYCDWSTGGDLPPEMKFYVDNVITVRIAQTPMGSQAMPVNVSQVLRGNWTQGGQSWGGQPTLNDYSMRPSDVASLHSATALVQMGAPNGSDIRHTPSTFYDGTKLSSIDNNMPSRYLSKALIAESAKMVSDPYDILGETFPSTNPGAGVIRDANWSANPLLNILAQNTMVAGVNAGFFTWNELKQLDPNVVSSDITYVIPLSKTTVQRVHHQGQTELWNSATNETVAASILAQTIPALMGRLLLTRVAFSVTNCTIDGQPAMQWMPGVGGQGFYETMNMAPALTAFQYQFIHEIFNSITQGGLYSVSMSIDARLTGDLWVSIAMNGQSPVDYVAPLYAGQLFSPVMTSDYNHLQGISHDLMSIASQVMEPVGLAQQRGFY